MLLDQNLLASLTSFKKTMERNLWDKLPVDVQILVFLWLSPLDLLRLPITCKYFHSLLSYPSFVIHYDRHRVTDATFLVASLRLEQHREKTVLNSVVWQQGSNVAFPWQSSLFDHLQGFYWWSSSYGDGFVCFQGLLTPSRGNVEKLKLLVLNPLFSHESKILTLPAESDSGSNLYTAIAFDRKNGVCKLILWQKLPDSRIITCVYNFKEGAWKTITECNGINSTKYVIGRSAQLLNERFQCWLCTDLISRNTVLVFDVEEETWKDPIPLGKGYFVCIGTHEKQLCVLSKTYEEQKTKFRIGKVDMEHRVWGLVEFIYPPCTVETYYHIIVCGEGSDSSGFNSGRGRYKGGFMICHVIPGKILAISEYRRMLNVLKVACLVWVRKFKDFQARSSNNYLIIYFPLLLFIFRVIAQVGVSKFM